MLILFGIVKEYGGLFDVSSVEGKGSCFIFCLFIDLENNEEVFFNV